MKGGRKRHEGRMKEIYIVGNGELQKTSPNRERHKRSNWYERRMKQLEKERKALMERVTCAFESLEWILREDEKAAQDGKENNFLRPVLGRNQYETIINI